MTDIYKEQKDEVEIRIKQLKYRRRNKETCKETCCKIAKKHIIQINERETDVTLL